MDSVYTTFVVLGGTGNLTKKKLLPALLDLYTRKQVPQNLAVVGFARSKHSNEDYRKFIEKQIHLNNHNYSEDIIKEFSAKFYYCQGDLTNEKDYYKLSEMLVKIDKANNICSNKIFYLAVAPQFFSTILDNLAKPGLYISCSDSDPNKGWSRILIEKPFGEDIETAKSIDTKLGSLFSEDQIYRIDHYLQKEMIQNILMFRFSNILFEPLWNKDHIEKIEVKILESIGAEERGAFYDRVGALRDMAQNHILQMLAAATIEEPNNLECEEIRSKREELLDHLVIPTNDTLKTHSYLAQYQDYQSTQGVSKSSNTETYFKLKTYIDNDRWQGVPIYLESGKHLPEKKAEVVVYFKPSSSCLCPANQKDTQNIVTFMVQPNEGIKIDFWVKKPGFTNDLLKKELSFKYDETQSIPDAYEGVLFDSLRGDQTRFITTNETNKAWEYITTIKNYWKDKDLDTYNKGSIPENKLKSV